MCVSMDAHKAGHGNVCSTASLDAHPALPAGLNLAS